METQILEKLRLLPVELQEQVMQFVEFLFQKYVEQNFQSIEQRSQAIISISEELRLYLDNRLQEMSQKPEKRYSIEEMEAYFTQKRLKLSQNV